jgi:hypothetical protein
MFSKDEVVKDWRLGRRLKLLTKRETPRLPDRNKDTGILSLEDLCCRVDNSIEKGL